MKTLFIVLIFTTLTGCSTIFCGNLPTVRSEINATFSVPKPFKCE